MNVKFYYVQAGSQLPTSYTAGDLYFNANDHKLYRAKDASTLEPFGGSEVNDSNFVHKTGDETVAGVKSFTGDMFVVNIGDFDGNNADTADTLQEVIAALGEALNDLNARLETVEKSYPNALYSYDEATQTLSITTL